MNAEHVSQAAAGLLVGTEGVCVGRDREIEQLGTLLSAAREGRSALVLVTGEPGSGKSTLLKTAGETLERAGARVVTGRCSPGLDPYQPFLSLGHMALRHVRADGLSDELGLRSFSEALDVLGGRSTGAQQALTPEAGRVHCFDRLATLFRTASVRQPLCLLVHDLDLAEPGALELGRFLATMLAESSFPGRTPFRGLMVCSVADPGRIFDEQALVSEELHLERIHLQGLGEEAVRAYLSSPSAVKRVLELTSGVPARLEAFLRGRPRTSSSSTLAAWLSPDALRLLNILTVAGRPLSVDMLGSLAALPPKALSASVALLASEGLVTKQVAHGDIQLSLARTADLDEIYRSLGDDERRSIHLALGRRMQQEGEAPIEACADHLLRAEAGQEAVAAALAAGQRLEIAYASARAADLYERALVLASDPDTRRVLLDRLCSLHETTGQLAKAVSCAETLRSLAPENPELTLRLVNLHLLNNDVTAAETELRALETRRPHGRGVQRTRILLMAKTADAHYLSGRLPEAMAEARRGLLLCEAQGPEQADEIHPLMLSLKQILAKVHLERGEPAEARSLVEEVLQQARRQGRVVEELRAMALRGLVHLRAGEFEAAERWYQQARDLAESIGELRLYGVCCQHLGVLAERQHALGRALECYQDAVSAWKKSGLRLHLSWVAIDLGQLYLKLGDLERARSMSALANHLTVGDPPLGQTINRLLLKGCLAGEELRVREARECLHQALALASSASQVERRARVGLALATLELTHGHAEDALRLAGIEAEGAGGPSLQAEALLLKARAEVELGLLEQAQATLSQLMDQTDAGGPKPDEIAWQITYVRMLIARLQGRPAEHRRLLREASALELRARGQVPEGFRDLLAEQPLRTALRKEAEALAISSERRPGSDGAEPQAIPPVDPPRAGHKSDAYREIVGDHPLLLQVLRHLDRVAPTETTVLIRGESGTGKELIARAIHRRSARASRSLVAVNCGALVESLLLSELFGHERGAFTGASQRHKGRFEAADGGTIFLDEIGDISPRTQAALLRVLQEREFERVGGTQTLHVDVRVIAATNRDLEAMVQQGKFREDLYYRLRGIQLTLPPLRRRPEDIPLLAEHFLRRISLDRGLPPKRLTEDAMTMLCRCPWPGNVRELENVLRSVSLLSDNEVLGPSDFDEYPELRNAGQPAPVKEVSPTVPALPLDGQGFYELAVSSGLGLKELKTQIELACIRQALVETGGNITRAAEKLGMKRPRLSQIIKENGLSLA